MKRSAEILWGGVPQGEGSDLAEDMAGSIVSGVSPAMLELAGIVEDVAPTDIPVLITGECGSGKEVLARDLFLHSRRTHQPFLKVPCSRLTQVQDNGDPFAVDIDSGGRAAERCCSTALRNLPCRCRGIWCKCSTGTRTVLWEGTVQKRHFGGSLRLPPRTWSLR